ncbi:MAG: DNA-binding domain-containing protein [Beijerinckiaceae bacterium]
MSRVLDQSQFAAALCDAQRPLPVGFSTFNGSDPAQRFGIYRNNVAVSLVDALAAKFPVVQALVGEEFFRAMARVFVADNLPQSRIMAHYGDAFPAFIAGFEPAQSLPYLADVARLEMQRVEAYHAADSDPVSADAFAAIAPSVLMDVRFQFHPSVRLLRSHYAVVSIWAAHQGIGSLEDVDPDRPEYALIARPAFDVEVTALSPDAAEIISHLMAGQPVAKAAVAAMSSDVAGLQAVFHHLIKSRSVIGIVLPGEKAHGESF